MDYGGSWRSAKSVWLYHDDGVTTVYALGHEATHHVPGEQKLDADTDLAKAIREAVRKYIREYECLVDVEAAIEGDTIHLSLTWVDGRTGQFSHTGHFDVLWR